MQDLQDFAIFSQWSSTTGNTWPESEKEEMIMSQENSTGQKEVFTRKASGLIRVMSPFSAFAYNVLTMSLIFPWVYLWSPQIFPGGSLWLGIIICTVCQAFVSITIAFLASAMPRSGGDYIFQSRILGGGIGFTSVMSGFVLWILQWVALAGWLFAALGIAPLFLSMGVAIDSPALVSIGKWAFSPTGVVVISVALTIFVAWFLCTGTRNYVILQYFLFFSIIIGFVVSLVVLVGLTPGEFADKINAFLLKVDGITGSTEALIAQAKDAGLDLTPKFSFLMTLGVAPLVWTSLQWASYSVQQGSEIKSANNLKSQMFIIVGSLTFIGVLLAINGYLFERAVGTEYLNASSAAYNGMIGGEALGTLVGMNFPSIIVQAVSHPIIILLVGIGFICNAFQITCNCYIGMTRDMVAMALDRTLPEWFSRVSPKWHAPVNAHLAYCVGGIIWIFCYNYVPGWFDLTLGVTFACGYVFVLSCFSGVLFPFKAKAIYDASPAAKYGNTIVYTGMIGTVFCGAMVLSFIFHPGLRLFSSMPTVLFNVGIIVVAAVIYMAMKSYHASRGIDITLAFKEIPPE
jgi:basic amino acid/polyamine antiporter, APA family